jgi:hypothetical protein
VACRNIESFSCCCWFSSCWCCRRHPVVDIPAVAGVHVHCPMSNVHVISISILSAQNKGYRTSTVELIFWAVIGLSDYRISNRKIRTTFGLSNTRMRPQMWDYQVRIFKTYRLPSSVRCYRYIQGKLALTISMLRRRI